MSVREYRRKCKQAGCNREFIVATPSLEQDRMVGFSEPEYCPEHRMRHARSYSRIACHHLDIAETEYGKGLIYGPGKGSLSGGVPDMGPGGIGRFTRPVRPFVESKNPDVIHEKHFPIEEKDDELLQNLKDHQVVVLVGPTGSGKSTHVPHMLLQSHWSRIGPIVVTQPRIQATRSIPRFVARLNNTILGPGAEIGFCHSNADEYDRRTRLLFMTDGKLINDIVSGQVADYSIVMIDEAHERNVNIDLILALMKNQLYLYPHLRLIIASATINHQSFIDFFGEEQVGFVPSKGKFFDVIEHYWGDPDDVWWEHVNAGKMPRRDELPRAISDIVAWMCTKGDNPCPDQQSEKDGHILVFLPGKREIDHTVSLIESLNIDGLLCLPLYAKRPLDEQKRALDPDDEVDKVKRRVVVSTNVAETSLTVEGVRYIIDTGYIKESYWNRLTCVNELQTVRHSQQGCRQRWGRAGRVQEGDAYLMYSIEEFEQAFPKETSPEIVRANLEDVLLKAKLAGVRDLIQFDWMPLSHEDQNRFELELSRALVLLQDKGALYRENSELTPLGFELAGVPSSFEVGSVIVHADQYALGIEAATLLPFLKLERGLQEIFKWDTNWDQESKLKVRQHHLDIIFGCRDDLDLYMKIWIIWEWLESDQKQDEWSDLGIDTRLFRETIEQERDRLMQSLMDWRKSEHRSIMLEKLDPLRVLIAWCMTDQVFRKKLTDTVKWDGYFDDEDSYDEYEDDLELDSSSSKRSTPLFERLNQQASSGAEHDLELAPFSVITKRPDADLIAVCTRKSNYFIPQRTQILGLNCIALDPSWLVKLKTDAAGLARLLASIGRSKQSEEHLKRQLLLFLPWIIPRETKVKGRVQGLEPDGSTRIRVSVKGQSEGTLGKHSEQVMELDGWLSVRYLPHSPPDVGSMIQARVTGYRELTEEIPGLELAPIESNKKAFTDFCDRFGEGNKIKVEMVDILPDPVDRHPLFIVREPITGLQMTMAAEDFCGGTRFRTGFATRFAIGDSFKVYVEKIVRYTSGDGFVALSRIRSLLKEYMKVPKEWHAKVQPLQIFRIDQDGLHVRLGGEYTTFVPNTLWPDSFDPWPGQPVDALVRWRQRDLNGEELLEKLENGEELPSEIDLGIDVDLRSPIEFQRFAEKNQLGSHINVKVVRSLDSGALLLDVRRGLKAIAYKSELDLDKEGNLRSSRSYTSGDDLRVIVVKLNEEWASIQCSCNRLSALPEDLKVGSRHEAKVVVVQSEGGRKEGRTWITAIIRKRHPVKIICNKRPAVRPGNYVRIQIDSKNVLVNELRASLIEETC